MTGVYHDDPHSAGSVPSEDLDLYALDSLPTAEHEAVERSLDAADPEQRESMVAQISSTREVASDLVANADLDVPPPPALRARILDLAAAERQRTAETSAAAAGDATVSDLGHARERARARHRPENRSRMRTAVFAAAAAVVLLAGGVTLGRLTDGTSPDGGPPVAAPPSASMPEQVSALLAAPDLEMTRGQVSGAGPATVLASRSADAAVITMPALPDPGQGRAYQLWLMGSDHDPIPAGTMGADEVAASTSAQLQNISGSEQVGLTEEPAGGSPAPTGDVLLALDLS